MSVQKKSGNAKTLLYFMAGKYDKIFFNNFFVKDSANRKAGLNVGRLKKIIFFLQVIHNKISHLFIDMVGGVSS